MTSCSNNEVRRCRPLLGTFVEIAATHDGAINAAFAAVERVQRQMSFHDAGSEVAQLNRYAVDGPMPVSDETYEVLAWAWELYDRTDGVFDIAVAPELMQWGILPGQAAGRPRGRTRDIALLLGRFVQFLRPLQIDLGGIAKGYAVDKAIEAMRASGATSGLVNAGGDLRCFGDREQQVWVRHPRTSGALLRLPALKDAALATSANSYQRQRRRGRVICAHVDGRTRQPVLRSFSVSVRAPSCLVADALTKVVLARGAAAASVLGQFGATAYIVRPDNQLSYCEERTA